MLTFVGCVCWIKFPNAAPGIYDEPMFMQQIYATSIISIMGIIYVVICYAFHLTAVAKKQTDDILRSIMPAKIVDRLKDQPGVTIAEQFGSVPVLFADLVGFTELTNQLGPERIVDLLDELFSGFDELAAQFGVEKIKTIGDAYLAVCGVPVPHPDPEKRILVMADAMHHFAEALGQSHTLPLKLRIGVAKGPLTAGVVGKSKYFYDIWGPVVNLASRLQTAASPGGTLISEPLQDSLAGQERMVDCGTLDLKGFGCVQAWQVLRADPSSINGASSSLDRESQS